MNDWNAPQWADIDASVMSDIDEYFDVYHEELETRYSDDLQSCSSTPDMKTKCSSPFRTPRSNSKIGKSSVTPRMYMLQKALRSAKTPTSQGLKFDPIPIKDEEKSVESSTEPKTIENSECENTEISEVAKEKEDEEEAESMEHNSTLIASTETEEEPTNRQNPTHEDVHTESLENIESTVAVTTDGMNTKMSNESGNEATSLPQKEKQPDVSLCENKVDKVDALDKKKINLPKPQTKRIITETTKNIKLQGKVRIKPTVLTSHARRQSSSKYRRVSNKYVTLAEAVSKFQNGTPERFRLHKDGKMVNVAASLQKVKQTMRVTYAQSPVLRCKLRARPVSVPTQEEREILEMEEIRKNRIKPNPIKQSVMHPGSKLRTTQPKSNSKVEQSGSGAKNKIEPKPSRIPEPKSQRKMMPPASQPLKKIEKKVEEPSKSMEKCKSMPARRTMISTLKSSKTNQPVRSVSALTHKTTMPAPAPPKRMEAKQDLMSGSLSTSRKDTSILSKSGIAQSNRKHTPCKRVIPTIVSTEEGPTIKDVEILHFGIPVGNENKKTTKIIPFSFDSQKKDAVKKTLKNPQVEEEKKPKTFHARPVPSYVLKPSVPKIQSKPPVMPDAPFSFQKRNETLLKKKKEMFNQLIEQEKQARVFHARPAPNFKPVFVRGASAENLRNCEKESLTKETKQRGLSQGSLNDNRENAEPNVQKENLPIPKLKNPLMTQNRKLKKLGVQ